VKRVFRAIPVVSIILVLLAYIHFERNSQTSAVTIPGIAGGIVCLIVIAIVLLFRIFNAAHEACYRKGLIPERLHFRYDVLIPVAVVAAAIQARWQGKWIVGIYGKEVPEWIFEWGDPNLKVAFVGAVIGVVFLLRILALARAVADAPLPRP
jgi:hypothetical protein